eukprot:2819392-Pleurochrysis_carterae.AAC.6
MLLVDDLPGTKSCKDSANGHFCHALELQRQSRYVAYYFRPLRARASTIAREVRALPCHTMLGCKPQASRRMQVVALIRPVHFKLTKSTIKDTVLSMQ